MTEKLVESDFRSKAFEQRLREVNLLRQLAVDAPYSSLGLHESSYPEAVNCAAFAKE
jgi:hypothetical protein